MPARWVAGDEVYGNDPDLRAECEAQRIGYVLAIGCDRRVPTAAGPIRADALVAGLPRWAWQQLSAGAGAKGERYYDWALDHPRPRRPTTDAADTRAGGCWSAATATPASWRSTAATPRSSVPLRELVRVAGRRWTVEESFQAGKGLAGLDEHQVRRWTSWRRWTLLAMLAHALLAVIAAHEHTDRPAPAGLIALTCNEIRRLFTVLVIEPRRVRACPRAWSNWRRRHQHRARTSHYQRQEDSSSMAITIYGWSRSVVLAIGAHPDDVEIGVGGLLAAHRAAGDSVIILTLCRGDRGGDAEHRQHESLAAAELIGARLFLEDLEDTKISPADPTVSIIERIVDEVGPSVVYTHSQHDRHQDHRAVHHAASVATRRVPTLACFQSPSATVDFHPNRFVPIDGYTDTKLALLAVFCHSVGDPRLSRTELRARDGALLVTVRWWDQL